jgi:hypothetical protein
MTIFLFKRIEKAAPGETQAMVVVAKDHIEARRIAACCEHDRTIDGEGYGDEGSGVWNDDELAPCKWLGDTIDPGAPPEIVLTQYYHA